MTVFVDEQAKTRRARAKEDFRRAVKQAHGVRIRDLRELPDILAFVTVHGLPSLAERKSEEA